MNFDQIAIIGLLAAMLAAFAAERWRVETVAVCGLAAGFLTGLVPIHSVFTGFANPAVITVIEILLIVSVLARSRVIDDFARRLAARVSSERALLAMLCLTGAGVSVFMNNIGALALLFPVALSLTERLRMPPGRVLMALSFATLLGGMCSLTGTPANLVVNQWMVTETGRSMGYFDLAIVGLPLVLAGVSWLVLASPRVFTRFGAGGEMSEKEAGVATPRFIAQRTISTSSRFAGLPLTQVETQEGIAVHSVLRDGKHIFARRDAITLAAGDAVLFEGKQAILDRLDGGGDFAGDPIGSEEQAMEAVVMPESLLVGSRVEDLDALAGESVRVNALASRRGRVEGRFSDLQFSVGDVISLIGTQDAIRDLASDAGLLVLSPRRPAERPIPRGLAAGLFAVGVLVTALGLAPVEIAFGGVVLALILTGVLDLRRALSDINWRIIVLLACMIPLGLAVESTGAARVVADAVAEGMPTDSPALVIAAVLAAGIVLTPFIDNVSTTIVLSPIAAELSVRTGTPIEPLLFAVAIGASIDFLTPFGHHNNAIVMGAGNYRFSDFSRLGAPLTAISFVVAMIALIAWA